MGVELVHVLPHRFKVFFDFDPFIVDRTIDVLAKNIHSDTTLAVDALIPEILVLRLKALQLEQLGHLNLEGLGIASFTEGLLRFGWAVDASVVDSHKAAH